MKGKNTERVSIKSLLDPKDIFRLNPIKLDFYQPYYW